MRLNLKFLFVVIMPILTNQNKCTIHFSKKYIKVDDFMSDNNKMDKKKYNLKEVNGVINGKLLSSRNLTNITHVYLCDNEENNLSFIIFGTAIFKCKIDNTMIKTSHDFIYMNKAYEIEKNLITSNKLEIKGKRCTDEATLYYFWPHQKKEIKGKLADNDKQMVFIFNTANIGLRYLEGELSLTTIKKNKSEVTLNRPNTYQNPFIIQKINEKLKILKDTVAELNDEINPKEDIL